MPSAGDGGAARGRGTRSEWGTVDLPATSIGAGRALPHVVPTVHPPAHRLDHAYRSRTVDSGVRHPSCDARDRWVRLGRRAIKRELYSCRSIIERSPAVSNLASMLPPW